MTSPQHESKSRLLDATLSVIRTKGYAATTIDDICAAAGLTKGSFFHHFKNKEDLAVAAAAYFGEKAAELFNSASYHKHEDPLDRFLGYIDMRTEMLRGELPEFTCLLGTMVQETYQTHPAIREACERHITEHAATLVPDIAAAKKKYVPRARWSPESLGLYTQAVIQGAFILAKARQGPEVAAECMWHLRRYIESQFHPPHQKGK